MVGNGGCQTRLRVAKIRWCCHLHARQNRRGVVRPWWSGTRRVMTDGLGGGSRHILTPAGLEFKLPNRGAVSSIMGMRCVENWLGVGGGLFHMGGISLRPCGVRT